VNVRDLFVDRLLNLEPIERRIDRILRLGDEYDARFTFYVTAGNVRPRNEHIVERIVDAGHEIGSHAYTHRGFASIEKPAARDQIQRSLDVLSEFYPVEGFRAPYLVGNEATAAACRELGLTYDSSQKGETPECEGGLWTVPVTQPQDGEIVHRTRFSTSHVVPAWCEFPGPGEVLLFHPWRLGSKRYIDALEQMLQSECAFGPVSEFIDDRSTCCITFDLDFLEMRQVYPHTFMHLFRSPHL